MNEVKTSWSSYARHRLKMVVLKKISILDNSFQYVSLVDVLGASVYFYNQHVTLISRGNPENIIKVNFVVGGVPKFAIQQTPKIIAVMVFLVQTLKL